MGQLTTIVFLSVLFLTMFYIVFLLWKNIWFKRYGGTCFNH